MLPFSARHGLFMLFLDDPVNDPLESILPGIFQTIPFPQIVLINCDCSHQISLRRKWGVWRREERIRKKVLNLCKRESLLVIATSYLSLVSVLLLNIQLSHGLLQEFSGHNFLTFQFSVSVVIARLQHVLDVFLGLLESNSFLFLLYKPIGRNGRKETKGNLAMLAQLFKGII